MFLFCALPAAFFTLSKLRRERPNDTTRPGASATATAPAPHAPPHATAANHLICPVLLACLHAYPLLLLSAPSQSIWRAGRLRCAESRRKCHLDAEAELEEEEAETNLPQAGEICNVNVIIIDFVANLPTQAHPCTCLLRPPFCPFYSVFGVLLSLSENVTTLAKRFAINESALALQLNLVYRSL